ncbi:hypothetical protein Aau02nite_21620 [Amorphoplanes auranticolor]|uniref:Uncharacterized protein n=1 Tax=Actinoplanes auranticolor TaxID=47988 RepID=A0A919S6V9_9ACTN|nr:hypothetical protein Aau02nite_21620 [Actinoplanes auranticolor]
MSCAYLSDGLPGLWGQTYGGAGTLRLEQRALSGNCYFRVAARQYPGNKAFGRQFTAVAPIERNSFRKELAGNCYARNKSVWSGPLVTWVTLSQPPS